MYTLCKIVRVTSEMAVQNLRRVALQSRHPAIQLLCYMQRTLQVCSRTAVNRVQHEQAIAHMVLEDEAHLVRTLLEWHISFWSRSVCLSLYKSVGQLRSLSPNSDDVPECKSKVLCSLVLLISAQYIRFASIGPLLHMQHRRVFHRLSTAQTFPRIFT